MADTWKITALRFSLHLPALRGCRLGSDIPGGIVNTLIPSYRLSVSRESYPTGIPEYRAIPATLPSPPPELLLRSRTSDFNSIFIPVRVLGQHLRLPA